MGDGYPGKKKRKGEDNMTDQGEKNTEGTSPKEMEQKKTLRVLSKSHML